MAFSNRTGRVFYIKIKKKYMECVILSCYESSVIFLLFFCFTCRSYFLFCLSHSLKNIAYFLIPLNHYPQETTEALGATSSMQDVLGMSTDLFGCLELFTEINACM